MKDKTSGEDHAKDIEKRIFQSILKLKLIFNI